MSAIQVSRTDTFEQQRIKINDISTALFNVTSGGSDLSTGLLRLGNGTIDAPSLGFTDENGLGLYRPSVSVIGYVANGKKLLDIKLTDFTTYQDIIVLQRKLLTSGLTVANSGQNYDEGSYVDIPILGGSGQEGTFDLSVTAWDGVISNQGSNYTPGNYTSVPLAGGNGTGAVANFIVDGIDGTITNTGSAYAPGTYTNVPLTGGSGTGAEATIVTTGDAAISGSITIGGSGYVDNTYNFVEVFNEPAQTFAVTAVANPNAGQPGEPNFVYEIDGNVKPLLTLEVGNTYRFDMSDTSLDPSNGNDPGANHRLTFQMADGSSPVAGYEFYNKGTTGTTGAFQDLIIKATAGTGTNVIRYDCANHQNMAPAGGNITINNGTIGQYGSQAFMELTVVGGSVTTATFVANGNDYRSGDVLQVSNLDMGNAGSGFEYTVSGLTFTGIVATVTITDSGINYALNDTLSANDANLGNGGTGSGFEYTVSTNPGDIRDFTAPQKGTGYQSGDVLTLGQGVQNLSGFAPGQSAAYATTLTAGNPTFTLPAGAVQNLQVGMTAATEAGSTGSLDPISVIQSINTGANSVTLDTNPLGAGAATVVFTTTSLVDITLADATGINIDDTVEKVSGAGVLAAGTTVANVDTTTNIVTLSTQPTTAGPIVFNVNPPYGNPADDFAYTINALGVIDTVTVNNDGNGYAEGDVLSVNPINLTQPIVLPVTAKFVQSLTFTQTVPSSWASAGDLIKVVDGGVLGVNTTTAPDKTQTITGPLAASLTSGSAVVSGLSSTTGISVGDAISEDASGNLAVDVTVASVDSSSQITMSAAALSTANVNLTFVSDEAATYTAVASTSSGSGVGATFDVVRNTLGQITSVSINAAGNGYADAEVITIVGADVGGATPAQNIVLEVNSISETTALEVISVSTSGSNISSILVETDQGSPFLAADSIVRDGQTSPIYTVDVAGALGVRYYINPDNTSAQLTPSFTLYEGSTYRFDLSDNSLSGTQFGLSAFPDGFNAPSLIENVQTTLDITSTTITVASTTGILPGMDLIKVSGTGELDSDTKVVSVDNSTTLTISQAPTVGGITILNFAGAQYTNGVTNAATYLDLKVTSDTPTLYYFDLGSYPDAGGEDGAEGTITIDPNNPKTFGSGFSVNVNTIQESQVITADVGDGVLTAVKVVSPTGEIDNISGASASYLTVGATTSVSTPLLTSAAALTLTGANGIVATNDLTVGLLAITQSTGALATAGELKTQTRLNVNDRLTITDNVIETDAASDLILTAPTGRMTKVTGFGGLTLPAGTTQERPSGAENGSIRFNTDSNQYEGYSASTASWASLGGVRDLDGNTYITAEETIGANDNTLWFYNDGTNTLRLTPTELKFTSVKTITSLNTGAPAFTNWNANSPVTVGQYLKYGINLYEVTTAGTTGTTGAEPTHTTGAQSNGTAELTWSQLAVAPLTFDDIEVVKIGPQSGIPLSINNELRLTNNEVSTDISDLVLRPNSGKKIVCNIPTSLVLPSGPDADRGVPIQGSVRFSQTTSQFEGYDGANWGSLGGVKDVDQNTYIIPETAPGANENILYFYNDGTNTLQLTANSFDFYSVDTIRSMTSNQFEITANLLTFNNAETTFDNTDTTRTFIHTTKQYLDLGLSSGVNVDPVLRLDDQGDVYLNTTFGTGTFTGVKVLDGELKEFELQDVKILTEDVQLTKGTINNGGSNVYSIGTAAGAKTVICITNATTNEKEFVEFGVIDNTSDVFHTQYGNVRTGGQLLDFTWEVSGANFVRVNFSAASGVANGDVLNVTIVSNITKI